MDEFEDKKRYYQQEKVSRIINAVPCHVAPAEADGCRRNTRELRFTEKVLLIHFRLLTM